MPSQTSSFEGLLEAVPDALVGVDQAGTIRFVNRQTEMLFGYQRDDLVGQPIERLVPESLRQVHTVFNEDYSAEPETRALGAGLELSGRQRDGTKVPVDISLSQMDTEDGPMVIASVHDLTDHKKAEEHRRRTDQLAAIVEYSGEAILSTTLDGIITSWNPAAERMYGYSSEEIVGRSVNLLRPTDRDEESNTILARIKEGHATEHQETVRLRKDGTVIPVLLTVSPIRDDNDAIVGSSLISSDISRQQEALESARSMIESSLDSLVSISPEGKITDVNEATVKVTGIPREALIGTDFSDYFTEPDKANRIYQRVFAEGMAKDYSLTMCDQDGTLTDVLYNASVYRDASGNVLGVFAAARDVTGQKRAQREVAEQRKRELGRLADLERFQRLTIGRELQMIELKKEIEYLRMLSPGTGEPDDQR